MEEHTVKDLVCVAHTFENISHISDASDTQVQLLSDSGKITCKSELPGADPEAGAGAEPKSKSKCGSRMIELYFVKRDRKNFKQKDHDICHKKISKFMSQYPHLHYTIKYMEYWLSDTMLVTVTGPQTDTNIKYHNLSEDLIRVVNLVKGVIFQKIMDRTCWLHLHRV